MWAQVFYIYVMWCGYTYAQLDHTRYNGRIPAGLDAQQLLPRFHAQVPRIVAGALQQIAVLSRVHRLRFFHHTEHRLIDLIGDQRFVESGHIQLGIPARLQVVCDSFFLIA